MDAALRKSIDDLGNQVEELLSVQGRVEKLEKAGQSTSDHTEALEKINEQITVLQKTKDSLDTVLQDNEKRQSELEQMKVSNEELEKQIEELVKKGLPVPAPGGAAALTPDQVEYKKQYQDYMRKGRHTDTLGELYMKATNTNTLLDPDGGFAVPEDLDRSIIEYARQYNPMRGICRAITVGTPDHKKIVNLGKATSGWVGETDGRPETESPKLGQLPAFMGEIYANPASTQIALDDMFNNPEQWLAEEVGIEFAEQENKAFTLGDGVNKPKGLLDYATAQVTDKAGTRPFGTYEARVAAAANTVGGDDLIDLIHAARAAYRNNGKWMMSNLSIAHMRKLKDNENNYLWQAGLKEGVPSSLLGYSIAENEDMPEITDGAGSKAVIFGDFMRAYLIVDRMGTRVLRDPYTNKPYIMFYTTKRVGGMGVDSLAVKVLEMA